MSGPFARSCMILELYTAASGGKLLVSKRGMVMLEVVDEKTTSQASARFFESSITQALCCRSTFEEVPLPCQRIPQVNLLNATHGRCSRTGPRLASCEEALGSGMGVATGLASAFCLAC
ncbi:hypothetical protein OS493_007692 [Desmophyllum pertusum]|uniref:Uncharacterized protein n=1 Tax=Desmophyllum pertusum TaxID=174260 RepID=A0A9W9YRU1_9CNID|nr:hypothetical protein OS493_007692 [Desmophyllum pertusum]